MRPGSNRRGAKRGQATAIGAVFFIIIAILMIGFLYEVYQTQEQMRQFDLERGNEKVRISHVGFDEYTPTDYNITEPPEGGLSSGDKESLAGTDENYFVVQSSNLSSSNRTATHFPSMGSVSYGSWVGGFLPTSVESDDDDHFTAQSAYQSGGTYQVRYFRNETTSVNGLVARQWTVEGPDMDEGSLVETGWVKDPGAYPVVNFTSERLCVSSIDNGTWNFYLWARLTPLSPAAKPNASLRVEVVKRAWEGLEYPIGVAYSAPLGNSFSNMSAGFIFQRTPLSETDSIVIKVYADFANASGGDQGKVSLQFDSLLTNSKAVTTIAQQQTVEARLVFSQIAADRPAQLNFTVISQYSVDSVDVTVQLWDYTLGGNGAWSTIVQAISPPTLEITIPGQEAWRYLQDGVGQVRIRGTKPNTAQRFLQLIDLVKLECPIAAIEWYSVFRVNQNSTDVAGLDIAWSGHSSTVADLRLYIYNFAGEQWDVVGSFKMSASDLRIGPLPFNIGVQDHVDDASPEWGEVWLSVNCTSAEPFELFTDSIVLRTYPVSDSKWVAIELVNEGGLTVHLVRLWIINGADHQYVDISYVYLPPSERQEISLRLPYSWESPETYVFKVVSERGNLWTGSARTA